jgi:hypothetical protein
MEFTDKFTFKNEARGIDYVLGWHGGDLYRTSESVNKRGFMTTKKLKKNKINSNSQALGYCLGGRKYSENMIRNIAIKNKL